MIVRIIPRAIDARLGGARSFPAQQQGLNKHRQPAAISKRVVLERLLPALRAYSSRRGNRVRASKPKVGAGSQLTSRSTALPQTDPKLLVPMTGPEMGGITD